MSAMVCTHVSTIVLRAAVGTPGNSMGPQQVHLLGAKLSGPGATSRQRTTWSPCRCIHLKIDGVIPGSGSTCDSCDLAAPQPSRLPCGTWCRQLRGIIRPAP